MKLDFTEAIKDVSKLDEEITELNKKKKKAEKPEEVSEINKQIEEKRVARNTKVKEIKTKIEDSDLDNESKETLISQVSNVKNRANTSSDALSSEYKAIQTEKNNLGNEINDSVSFGTAQWNAQLEISSEKLASLEKQLENENLTAKEKLKLITEQKEEQERQLAIQHEIASLESRKSTISAQVKNIDNDMQSVNTELQQTDLSDERKIELEKELDKLNVLKKKKN